MGLRKTVEELANTHYMTRKVLIVDENDEEMGIASLVDAHRGPGIKHRAFSLILYRVCDGIKEILLQKRSEEKPVFPLYWTNTCCYNMLPDEKYLERAATRVKEEMGVTIQPEHLKVLYRFSYYAPDIEGWCENEWDSVIVGQYDGGVTINPHEAADFRWIEWTVMKQDMLQNPDLYAPWWKMIVDDGRLAQYLSE
jgi:isopentenyl-diphosphate delta-isomerase